MILGWKDVLREPNAQGFPINRVTQQGLSRLLTPGCPHGPFKAFGPKSSEIILGPVIRILFSDQRRNPAAAIGSLAWAKADPQAAAQIMKTACTTSVRTTEIKPPTAV